MSAFRRGPKTVVPKSAAEIDEIVRDAYRCIAPKTLVTELDNH